MELMVLLYQALRTTTLRLPVAEEEEEEGGERGEEG